MPINSRQWSRVKELLDVAFSSSPDSAETLRLDSEEQEVRVEVERLIRQHADAGSFLNVENGNRQAHAFEPGQLVATRYVITEWLGQGGMGEVYRAKDRELNEERALKMILPQFLPNENAVNRFKREIAVSQQVTHPNVCRIFDMNFHLGKFGEPLVMFMSMEYLAGETLCARLKRGRLSSEQAFPLIRQMADGIHAAHMRGIVHRDLKSSNVMLVYQGEEITRAVITDFGLAKEVSAVETQPSFTAPHQVVGTPAYMAPELLFGTEASIASDIFAFGLIQFEMATGRRPSSPDESPNAIVPDLNPCWNAAIKCCLRRDPRERFSSVLEAVQALAPSRPLPRKKNLRYRVLAAALSVILACGAGAFAKRSQVRAFLTGVPQAKHIAVFPFAAIGSGDGKQAFADGMTEAVTSKLYLLERFQNMLWVVPSSEIRSRNLTSAESARKAFGVTLVITGNVQMENDKITVTANLVDARRLKQLQSRTITLSAKSASSMQYDVMDSIADMLGIAIPLSARRVLAAGQASDPDAYRLYQEGLGYLSHFEKKSVEQSIALFQESVVKDPKFALAYTQLAAAYLRKYHFTKNPTDVELSKLNVGRALQLDRSLPAAQTVLGGTYAATGHGSEAIAAFRNALKMDPADGVALVGLAQAYENAGLFTDAEAAFQRAIEARPDFWLGYLGKGAFYYNQSKYSEAERMFKSVVELTPESILGYRNLGATYLAAGHYAEAERELRRAIQISPNALAYSNLSVCYSNQGRRKEAVEALEKAVELDPNSDINWRNLGDARQQVPGFASQAQPAYRNALAVVGQRLEVNPSSADLLVSKALYLAKLHEPRDAVRVLKSAYALHSMSPALLFKATDVWELVGERGKALMSLSEAVQRGYSWELVLKEPELASLRRDPKFKALAEKRPH